jgi:hypothetical protein
VVSPTTLSDGMLRGYSEGFWHFWHLLTLEISKVGLPGKGAEQRVIEHNTDPG